MKPIKHGKVSQVNEDVRLAEVDGIPAYWAPAPGPLAAALVFRVGIADESLATSGVTHLVEHLACWPVGHPSYVCDASVSLDQTAFRVEGTEEEVVEFLNAVASGIRDLPLSRLESERRILKTEIASRELHTLQIVLGLRFGAQGYGLCAFEQLGLARLTAEEVREWARLYFTTGNAALWMTSAPPAGLHLELPEGARRSPPRVEPLPELDLPAFTGAGSSGLTLSGTSTRDRAARMVSRIVEERLRRALRLERGIAYDVFEAYDLLGADLVHVAFGADSLDEHAAEARDELLRTLDDLASTGPTEEELARDLARTRKHLDDPFATGWWLDYCVARDLRGRPVKGKQALLESSERVTPESGAEVAAHWLTNAILLVPEALEASDSRGFKLFTPWSRSRVDGRPLRLKGLGRWLGGVRLIVAEEGLSLVGPDAMLITVRFDECEVVLRSPNQRHLLIGRNGTHLWFGAHDFRDGALAVEAIDRAVPAEKIVMLGDEEFPDFTSDS